MVDLYVAHCNDLQTSAWFSDLVLRNTANRAPVRGAADPLYEDVTVAAVVQYLPFE